jgi:hypothetical protein
MGIFDSLFSSPDAAPLLDTINIDQTLKKGTDFNIDQFKQFEEYAPGQTQFIQNLFNQSYGAQGKAADQAQFDIGTQLVNKGQTNLMGDFFDYARRQGLETAAATGAPISGSFAQGLGSSLGAKSLMQNQITGINLLNNYGQTQGARAQGFMRPSLNLLQQNYVSPTARFGLEQYNNQIANQNKYIDFANNQATSWFDTLLSDTLKGAVGMPFQLFQNATNVVANAPQMMAGMMAAKYMGGAAGAPVTSTANSNFNTNPAKTSGSWGLNSNMSWFDQNP